MTYFAYFNSGSAVGTFSNIWMFGKNDLDDTPFTLFVNNVILYCVKNYKIK